ncbi:CapA family protein [Fulvivirga sediminis]|uniref:CapA family protein n=1 Tax=Fulvivirga sediminis TaxID=2803949 RepID=A0A937F9U8_9BACT|nr:CapA family protein [Fulvivirga sediminis]MBL3657269.1 CapA family protein [Fulvivirga sediminis]
MQIVFGGDVMLDRGIRSIIEREGLTSLMDSISPVFTEVDYGIVNLECPIGTEPTPLVKKYVFLGSPEVLPELSEVGITHGIMANNHSYDHGRKAMTKTAEHLIHSGITTVGYGSNQGDACAPTILKKGHIEVALFSSVILGLEAWMYLENEPGMCQATINDIENSVKQFKASNANSLVIVSLHWGIEYHHNPTSIQRRQARALIKAGADAIIGHHPHVAQSIEYIEGKPVFYSLGNLIFDNKNPVTHDGILVKLDIDEALQLKASIIPYQTDNCKPLIMRGKQKADFISQLYK